MNMLHRRDAMTAGGLDAQFGPLQERWSNRSVTISPFREALATAMWMTSPRPYVAAPDDRIQAINLTDLHFRPGEVDCRGLAEEDTTRI
ncbi:MAG: hypothetical protein QGF59_29110 [Pirellulaceae bacterium]|jgi:hypothetical protein|nr:hypothetical protein [Pirellulaceae bacterium]